MHGANKLNLSNRQRTPEKQKKTPMERGGSQGPLPVIIKTSGNSGNIIIIKLTIKKNVELIHYLSDSIVFQIQIILNVLVMFVAVNSVRVIGESNIMEEYLKLSENHVTVFVTCESV